MNILVVGAGGQIGTELVPHLQTVYGKNNIIAADLKEEFLQKFKKTCNIAVLDALDMEGYRKIVQKNGIGRIYNLVALLSATGEKSPKLAWDINMGALLNSLELAKEFNCSIFTPSSIGVFGHSTPHDNTPQDTVMRPSTMYGACKIAGELLSDYYHLKFGVDARSVRYPGIISNGALPGGGTTDYAVEVFYEILRAGRYTCPIPEDTYMDMLYMPDALEAAVQLMEADPKKLRHRNSFNVTCMSFTPKQLFAAIKRRVPNALFDYEIDPIKANISSSWPNKMDDSCAREEWGWSPEWDMERMVDDMLHAVAEKVKI